MDESQKPNSSWWQTLPGILTAAAATATAIAGLIAVLHQAGLFGGGSDERKNVGSSQKNVSLVGSWVGSPYCTVVIYKDDGKNVEGSCDKAGYRHKFAGTYDDLTHIRTTITRTDPSGCVTTTIGYIKIISSDSAEFGQKGWNGCGETTDPDTRILSRP
jgi:hypothetical protein